ncbi:hypothetical protein AAVH_33513, partial [Aphelenchoides avenae]
MSTQFNTNCMAAFEHLELWVVVMILITTTLNLVSLGVMVFTIIYVRRLPTMSTTDDTSVQQPPTAGYTYCEQCLKFMPMEQLTAHLQAFLLPFRDTRTQTVFRFFVCQEESFGSIKQRLRNNGMIVGNIRLTRTSRNLAIEDTKTPAVLDLGQDSEV